MPDWVDNLTPEEREKWDEFVEHFRRDAVEKIAGSSAFVTIWSEKADVKLAAELGYGILLGKPIILVVPPGLTVNRKLLAVADKIVIGAAGTAEGRERLRTALGEVLGEILTEET